MALYGKTSRTRSFVKQFSRNFLAPKAAMINIPVRPMVTARIYERFKLGEKFAEFRWKLIPSLVQPRHGWIWHTHHDGEECIQVLVFLAAKLRLMERLYIRGWGWIKSTHYAASLMNFFSSDTRLLRFDVDATSVTTQYWISLKRLMKTSRFDVIWTLQTDNQVGREKKSKEINFPQSFSRAQKEVEGGGNGENFFNYIKFAFFYVHFSATQKNRQLSQHFFVPVFPFCDCYRHSPICCARWRKVSPSAERSKKASRKSPKDLSKLYCGRKAEEIER